MTHLITNVAAFNIAYYYSALVEMPPKQLPSIEIADGSRSIKHTVSYLILYKC